MSSEPWAGEVQRGRLKGFARLRAILWRRSLRLYERWTLRDRPWVARLRREMKVEYAAVDLDDAARVGEAADIFGETPIITVVQLLRLAERFGDCPHPFLDLGSGTGITCLTAAALGYPSLGLEREEAWVAKALRVADRLELNADFRAVDLLTTEWPEEATVFAVGTAFEAHLKTQIRERVLALKPGSLFLAGDWPYEDSLEPLWSGPLPVDWGVIPFSIYRVN